MVVACPQCGASELIDEASFEGGSRLNLECSKCGKHYQVRAPAGMQSQAGGGEAGPAQRTRHTGLTTVVEVRNRLPEGKKVALVAMKGPAKGTTFPINKPEVTLGRLETDVLIPDPQISAKHCSMEVRETYAILHDLGSTNGIYVGNEQVKTAILEHLTEFRIGGSTLMFTVTARE